MSDILTIGRVNLGCGDRYAEGWWNVDTVYSPHRKDQVVDLTDMPLPWPRYCLTHAYAGHILEHLTPDQCHALLVELLCKRMFSHGQLLVVGPDVEVAQRLAERGELHDITVRELREGGHRWPGDEHRWECTEERVVDMLVNAGWKSVEPMAMSDVPELWPVAERGPVWQCVVRGVTLL